MPSEVVETGGGGGYHGVTSCWDDLDLSRLGDNDDDNNDKSRPSSISHVGIVNKFHSTMMRNGAREWSMVIMIWVTSRQRRRERRTTVEGVEVEVGHVLGREGQHWYRRRKTPVLDGLSSPVPR